jgi:hypothetical protein
MAIEIKRQQLLDKKPKAKKPSPTQQQKVPQHSQQNQAQNKSVVTKKKSSRVKKFVQFFFSLFFIAFIIAPKPQLLIYKKLDLVANSIYIPGWFGQPGFLLDSDQRVVIDKPLGLVYLCYKKEQPKEHCNRFNFIEQKGIFSALGHYKDNNL